MNYGQNLLNFKQGQTPHEPSSIFRNSKTENVFFEENATPAFQNTKELLQAPPSRIASSI